MPLYRLKHTAHFERNYKPGEFLPAGIPGRTIDKLRNVGWLEEYHTLQELEEDQRVSAQLAAESEADQRRAGTRLTANTRSGAKGPRRARRAARTIDPTS